MPVMATTAVLPHSPAPSQQPSGGLATWLRATFGEAAADDPAAVALEVCDGDPMAAGQLLAEWHQPVAARPF